MTTPFPLYADISRLPYSSLISGNDITLALASAVSAVAANEAGGVVLLPLGLNWTCGLVTVPSDAVIRGRDRTLTKLTLKAATAGGVMFSVNGASNVTLSGFTAASSLASNPTNLGAIRLDGGSNHLVVEGMGFIGWVGVNAGTPQGAGISLAGKGSDATISNCVFDQCYDGISTYEFTDGLVENCMFNACQRFGGSVGARSHRWRIVNNQGDGNSTTEPGAGFAAINSNDIVFDRNRFWGAAGTKGHGMQFNGCHRAEATNGDHQFNAISGQDFHLSPYGKSANNVLNNNSVRGLEIDTTSTGHLSVNDTGIGNTDVDLSIFRSADVEVIDFTGNLRIWDAAAAATATIANGGSGYAVGAILTATGGRFKMPFQASVTAVSGGAVTAVTISNVGEYWEFPLNPVVVSGGLGAGCTLTVDWADDNSNTCAGATVTGGGASSALLIATGAASGVRLSNWRGAVSDPGLTIVSSQYIAPFAPLTLSAGWVAYAPTWQAPAYFRDADGWVHLVGTMKNGTVTTGTTIGVLPVGYRPSLVAGPWQVFGVSGVVSLFIDTNGNIVAQSTLDAARTSLDGISFKSA